MNKKIDVYGFELEEGIEILKRVVPEKEILKVETFSRKEKNENFKEARILRVKETEKNIQLVVGYF